MRVTFFRLTTEGAVEMGELILTDGLIRAAPAKPAFAIALNAVLSRPIRVYMDDGRKRFIDPISQPEAFLRAVPVDYSSSYTWATFSEK